MFWILKGMIKGLIAVIIITIVAVGAITGFVYSPFFRYPTGGEYPEPRIRNIIWPTIGCPAMVMPGETLEIEVDLGLEGEGEARWDEDLEWSAVLVPAREELDGLSYTLEHKSSRLEASDRWPAGSREGGVELIWNLEFDVPGDVSPELYDLSLEGAADGESVYDTQPHAVAVMEDDDDDFTFITLADIHVHERDNSTFFVSQTDKGIAPDGDPLFLEEAIAQVNLIGPDFVLMLGDYIRGQRRPGELLTEYENFYDTLLELEVPAFLLPGNHDQYINEIDGAEYFEKNIGPLYFSFDVGGCHFCCLNSYEWPEEDRVVMNKLAYMEPRKWQGQVLGAGDELDETTYTGQLSWAEDDLSSNRDAPLRVMALHHDPYTPDGNGYSFANVYFFLLHVPAGGGEGRDALLELASRHRVGMVFGGHLHVDEVGMVPWENGGGETVYSCQSCVYFGGGEMSEEYPGYRLVEVEEGRITDFSYLDGVHSWPFYDGSVLEGETDLDGLDRPALRVELEEDSGEKGRLLDWKVSSYLAERMKLRGLVAPVPESPDGEYRVENGRIYRTAYMPGRPGWALLYLETEVAAGVPGESAELPGEPAEVTVSVRIK